MAPLPYSQSNRIISEPEEFSDVATGISLNVDFRRRQEDASRVEQYQSPQWALDWGVANVQTHVSGVLAAGWGSLCLNMGAPEARWNGLNHGPGAITLVQPGQELDGHTAPGFSWVTMAIPPGAWANCLRLAGCEEAGFAPLITCQPSPAHHEEIVRRLGQAQALFRGAAQTPALGKVAATEAAEVSMHCFLTACELASRVAVPRDSLRNRVRLVKRAEAWMRERLEETFQVEDVCLALHVSRRELEYAFRAVLDESPRDHLQTLRLNAIRRVLVRVKEADTSVIEIAQAHGMTHLGRFAGSYRKLFGEAPSATLRRKTKGRHSRIGGDSFVAATLGMSRS